MYTKHAKDMPLNKPRYELSNKFKKMRLRNKTGKKTGKRR